MMPSQGNARSEGSVVSFPWSVDNKKGPNCLEKEMWGFEPAPSNPTALSSGSTPSAGAFVTKNKSFFQETSGQNGRGGVSRGWLVTQFFLLAPAAWLSPAARLNSSTKQTYVCPGWLKYSKSCLFKSHQVFGNSHPDSQKH